jgi:hypothetical protein
METDGALAPVLHETTSFLNYFSDMPDRRQAGKVACRLDEILLLARLATLAGAGGHGYRPVRAQETQSAAALSALRQRHAEPRSFGRSLRRTGPCRLPPLLYGLGRWPGWSRAGGHRHQWKDLAELREQERQGRDPYGVGLRGATTPRPGANQGEWHIERDRCHSSPPRHAGDRGRRRHHRRHGMPARPRPQDHRQKGRWRSGPEGPSGQVARRARIVRDRAESTRLRRHHDQCRRDGRWRSRAHRNTGASKPVASSSFTILAGCRNVTNGRASPGSSSSKPLARPTA